MDLVFVDQRGMGLSLAGLLDGFVAPTSFSEFLAIMDDHESIMWATYGQQGDLASPVTFTDSKGVQHDPPCLDLNRTYTWMLPNDYGNHTQVRKFFNDKANVTSTCSARFDRPDGESGSYTLLQCMGTQALAHDVEWLRWAFGGPAILFWVAAMAPVLEQHTHPSFRGPSAELR